MTTSEIQSQGLQTGHVGLNVRDVDRSKNFYQAIFGFEVAAESREPGKRFVFLGRNKRLVLTLWEQSAEDFNKESSGLHHLSFQVGSIEGVRAAESKLRQTGAKPIYDGIVPHGEGIDSGGVYFEDPDGIRLEIYAPSGAGDHPAPTPGAPSCGFF